MTMHRSLLSVSLALLLVELTPAQDPDCFCIRVVDSETGRGVPLVELKTVNDIRYYTDSAGSIEISNVHLPQKGKSR